MVPNRAAHHKYQILFYLWRIKPILKSHCVKSVQIRRFCWSVFSRILLYSVRIQENTDQKTLRIWTLFTQWVALLQNIIFTIVDTVNNENYQELPN